MRQFQGDGGGPGLTLGTVGLQIDAGEGNIKIVLVGAGQALARFQLRPVMTVQVIQQILRQLAYRGKGVFHRGHGLVFQPEFLRAAGKLIVIFGRGLAEAVVKPGTVGDQQGTHLTQPGIVLRQDPQHGRIFEVILQDPALLVQDPVVFNQGCVVIRP